MLDLPLAGEVSEQVAGSVASPEKGRKREGNK
jgi:hypothetical protein